MLHMRDGGVRAGGSVLGGTQVRGTTLSLSQLLARPRAPLTWLAAASRGEPPTEDAVALWSWATDVTSCSFAPTSQAQVCQEDVWRAQSSVHPARREVTRAQKRRGCGSYVTLGWSLNLLGPSPL